VSPMPVLAKFDLIDMEGFRYYEISPNTWAAIKAINPNFTFTGTSVSWIGARGPAVTHVDLFRARPARAPRNEPPLSRAHRPLQESHRLSSDRQYQLQRARGADRVQS
jgi:hypothetical protein